MVSRHFKVGDQKVKIGRCQQLHGCGGIGCADALVTDLAQERRQGLSKETLVIRQEDSGCFAHLRIHSPHLPILPAKHVAYPASTFLYGQSVSEFSPTMADPNNGGRLSDPVARLQTLSRSQ